MLYFHIVDHIENMYYFSFCKFNYVVDQFVKDFGIKICIYRYKLSYFFAK